ncbi:MAG: hypothetical protein OIF40_06565 [Mangrovicoccus sp.]|nr:hypothetical protein [Mangrovicoccus sp.]
MGLASKAMQIAALAVCVTGCGIAERGDEQALIAEFDMIEDRAEFVSAVVGKNWQSDAINLRFGKDGTMRGDINGVPVTGAWEWHSGQVCTNFQVSDSGGAGCAKIGTKPGEMLVIPRSGTGAPYTYRAI